MKYLILPGFLLIQQAAFTQQKEELYDYSFKPASVAGYYYVVTEKTDSGFQRQAWYISQKSLFMSGLYQDEACEVPNGSFLWFHHNGRLKQSGRYVNGLREGAWLTYDEDGLISDSSTYVNGKRKGISLSFHKNGYLSDSTRFDGAGNGVQVSWYNDGTPSAAGYWTQDTLKKGRWKYFHANGTVMAIEDYDSAGKLTDCSCYDEAGKELDKTLCGEQEASVDKEQWLQFLQKNLQKVIEKKAAMGITGTFTVVVRFLIDEQGRVSNVTPLTNYGYKIEEDVLKIFRSAPKWSPGRWHGKLVKSYHTQPLTFSIKNE